MSAYTFHTLCLGLELFAFFCDETTVACELLEVDA
jgi:hypothetical protein